MNYVNVHSGLIWGTVYVLSLGLSKETICLHHALLFPDCIAAQSCQDGRDEGGFDRDEKRGFILVFTLCTRHNCVIKKNRIFFPTHVCSGFCVLLLCPDISSDDYRKVLWLNLKEQKNRQ